MHIFLIIFLIVSFSSSSALLSKLTLHQIMSLKHLQNQTFPLTSSLITFSHRISFIAKCPSPAKLDLLQRTPFTNASKQQRSQMERCRIPSAHLIITSLTPSTPSSSLHKAEVNGGLTACRH